MTKIKYGYHTTSQYEESIRTLRTFLQLEKENNKLKTILITSSLQSEGKSTFSSKLALSFAQAGAKTLILDCDFRNSSIGKILNIKNRIGLADVIVDKNLISNAIIKSPNQENLDIILSGGQINNPAELLGTTKMKLLLNELEEKYDYIIIDSPPVGLLSDPLVLMTMVDGVLFIVKEKHTKIQEVKEAVFKVKKANGNILGFVMTFVENKFNKKASYSSYYR